MLRAAFSQLVRVPEAGYRSDDDSMRRLLTRSKPSDAPSRSAPRDELAELAKAVERGDRQALRTFLTTIVPHLLRVARRVLGPAHPFVEDVAHDAAYAVVEQLPAFRGEGTVLNFSRRVAVLTAMNMRRRDAAQKRARAQDPRDPDTIRAESADPERSAASTALIPIMRELLDELPEALGEAFALNVILGYTVQEIAELAHAPVETVRSRLRLAKQRLKERALAHPGLRDSLEFGAW